MLIHSRLAMRAGVLLPFILCAGAAAAEVRVISTVPVLASIAKEVGGDRIEAESLSKGYQDPHTVQPRPSLMLKLNHADLLLHVGLGLEDHWLPEVLLGARNPKLAAGEPGNLDCSQAIAILDVPSIPVSGAMGDVFRWGNPFYWLTPVNAKQIARSIVERLVQIDPEGHRAYQQRLNEFVRRVDAREQQWQASIRALHGTRIATYRKTWSYLSNWLGLEEVGYVEPKPGIPPDAGDLAHLVGVMKAEGARLLLVETYFNSAAASRVAAGAHAKLLQLPADVGGTDEATDWASLIDVILRALTSAR